MTSRGSFQPLSVRPSALKCRNYLVLKMFRLTPLAKVGKVRYQIKLVSSCFCNKLCSTIAARRASLVHSVVERVVFSRKEHLLPRAQLSRLPPSISSWGKVFRQSQCVGLYMGTSCF